MKKKIDYDNWSKDELVKEIKRIKETTYGLVWHRDLPEEKGMDAMADLNRRENERAMERMRENKNQGQ